MTFSKICSVSNLLASAVMVLGVSLASPPAHAIFLEADNIDADGAQSTVDLWFFSFNAAVNATIKANLVAGPPIPGGDLDMIIYLDDGTFSNVFASDTGGGGIEPSIAAAFPLGAYLAVVANHPLPTGDFGPTHFDAAFAAGSHEYEFNGPEPTGGSISINCLLSGNLGGGYTTSVFVARSPSTCSAPAPVPEPGTLSLFSIGLLGLAFAARRKARVQH